MNRNVAQKIATDLLRQHGLTSLGWRIAFDSAKRRAGVCRYATKTISFSVPILTLNDEASFRETALHEIAHALVGPGHGHDMTWKRKCIAIGGTGARCSTKEAAPAAPYTGIHDGCEQTWGRHRTPKGKVYCPPCQRRHGYTEVAQIRWVRTATLKIGA